MSYYTNCPGCRTALALGEHLQGKKVRCKRCGHIFVAGEMLAAESEQDGAEDKGEAPREQIQHQPQLPEYAPPPQAEEPAFSSRRKPKESELPRIPSLRRSRWGRSFSLLIGGLTLFLLGGATVFVIVYWRPFWSEALEQLDSYVSGSWPVPVWHSANPPEDLTVTLHIAAVENDDTHDTV